MKGKPIPTFPILLVFLLTVFQTQSQCPTCIDLSFYSCKVCYNTCPSVNQTNIFLNCDYTYCSDYSYDENGTSTCIGYETKQLPENQCFPQCCKIQDTTFSVPVLQQCEEKSKKNTTILIAVICSVFGAILIIMIICCGCFSKLCECIGSCCGGLCECLGGCLQYIFRCRCCRRAPEVQQPVNIEITSVHLPRTYIWCQSPQPNQLIEDQTSICSICLINRANTVNKCGHCFHLDCISEWLKRNPHCPVCRSEDAHFVKFYCRGCCRKYIEFDLAVEKDAEKAVREIKGPNCLVCQ